MYASLGLNELAPTHFNFDIWLTYANHTRDQASNRLLGIYSTIWTCSNKRSISQLLSWLCRRCPNYIFILDLTPGFNILRKKQLQAETRSIWVLGFSASYIRDVTVYTECALIAPLSESYFCFYERDIFLSTLNHVLFEIQTLWHLSQCVLLYLERAHN